MKEEKFLGIFSTNGLIWFHYVLLTGALFGLHELSMWLGLETPDKIIYLFVFYVVGLGLADQIIHAILRVD